jgi:hypothetical protein
LNVSNAASADAAAADPDTVDDAAAVVVADDDDGGCGGDPDTVDVAAGGVADGGGGGVAGGGGCWLELKNELKKPFFEVEEELLDFVFTVAITLPIRRISVSIALFNVSNSLI